MNIYRPLWEDGAFLAPQQFQQQALWDAHLTDTVARMGLAYPWGVVAAEFELRLSSQENTAWPTCPVTRLVRNIRGQWCRDLSFIPPLLTLLDKLLEASLPS